MEIKFDEILHKYTVDGKEVISVTQLLQKHKITPSYDAVDKALLRMASERGTLIHEEVEKWIESGESGFTEEAEKICDFLFERADGNTKILSEQMVANDVVAGRFDVIYTHAKKEATAWYAVTSFVFQKPRLRRQSAFTGWRN